MLDLVIKDAFIVDGTGADGFSGSVGIRDERIVGVGDVDEPAKQTLEAGGLTVAPGFIDVHTHYDAQLFWDRTLSPSPLHGVTSVFAGNCGFSLTPVTLDMADYLMRMLARVEGMPLESLEASLDLKPQPTADFFASLDRTLSPNIGFMMGHSALRTTVMGEEAIGSEASEEQLAEMVRLLHDGLAAGAMGFSSTWSVSHNDHNGKPVPSRYATVAEMVALSAALRDHAGTSLEFIPGVAPFTDESFDIMTAMSAAADRPLNWNMLQVYEKNRDLVAHQLGGSLRAAERGAAVIALTLPDRFKTWLNFRTGFILDILPGWGPLMALPPAEKLALMRDPQRRAAMNDEAQTATGEARTIANWPKYVIVESRDKEAIGRTIGELAEAAGKTPWDTLADLVVGDELETVITAQDRGQAFEDWQRRVEVWRDPRTIIGASDAGAHLDMIDSFSYATTVIANAVRTHRLLSIEEAVHLLTQRPAQLYGLTTRGVIADGNYADLVVFDPDTIAPNQVETRYDMPAGAGRIYGGATGVHHVLVSGTEIVRGGEFTDGRPGRVLRSGQDTQTVYASKLAAELLAHAS